MPFSPVFKFAGKFYHFGQKKKKMFAGKWNCQKYGIKLWEITDFTWM